MTAEEYQKVFQVVFEAARRLVPEFAPYISHSGMTRERAILRGITMDFDGAAIKGMALAIRSIWGLQMESSQVVTRLMSGCQVHAKRGLLRLCGNDISSDCYKKMERLLEGAGTPSEIDKALEDVKETFGKRGDRKSVV